MFDEKSAKRERRVAMLTALGAAYGKTPVETAHEDFYKLLAKIK